MPTDQSLVAVCEAADAVYPRVAPFHPDCAYPEIDGTAVGAERNVAYETVRACFRAAGLDADRYGTPAWNPLAGLMLPGETVLLKPNLVRESHPRDREGWLYTITHGSIVRAVADYVWRALEGRGRVIVADAPQTDASFSTLCELAGLTELRAYYRGRGLDFDVLDLRKEVWTTRGEVVTDRRPLAGDPEGYVAFDLGDESEFVGHGGAGRYYGADYDDVGLNAHHAGGHHEYLIAASAITCDVLFSLPKLKTHKKAGITASLKNLVGVNGDKNWLPHHTEGDPSKSGDEHPSPDAKHRFERRIVPYFRKLSLRVPGFGPWISRNARRVGRHVFGDTEEVIRSGNWWGNDTAWRMCLDLNKIVLYGNRDGTLRSGARARKRHFVLVDGIIGGEGSGPLNADPVRSRLVLFGMHPPSVDAACAYMMGFDPERIPVVRQAFRCAHHPLAEWGWRDVHVTSDRADWNRPLVHIPSASTRRFRPHFGWRGHIEQTPREPHPDDGLDGARP